MENKSLLVVYLYNSRTKRTSVCVYGSYTGFGWLYKHDRQISSPYTGFVLVAHLLMNVERLTNVANTQLFTKLWQRVSNSFSYNIFLSFLLPVLISYDNYSLRGVKGKNLIYSLATPACFSW